MNIVLIGMRGSGKTTVAKMLSKKLKKEIIETDDLIAQKAGMAIADVVKNHGWEYFRDLESEVIADVSKKDNIIISCGGGVVTRAENIKALKRNGKLFWLQAGVNTLVNRIGDDSNRPSLTGKKSGRKDLQEVLKQRYELYKNAADEIIETENISAEKVMEIIVSKNTQGGVAVPPLRWKLNAKTTICCIIGDPVEHSLSPIMHNAGYIALGLNFAFVAFHVKDLKSATAGVRALNIRGAVVTVPHKIEVLQYVDVIDEEALAIGAANTIVNDNGVLTASNTDWIGAITTLKKETTISGKKVVVLGAGGAARAVIYGLKREGARIIICNRTLDHAKKIAQEFSLEGAYQLDEKEKIASADIIINTTSVGMTPQENEMPIPSEFIKPHHVVYDIVYTPKET
ncbi:MAG: shikimate dehydrogenase, partial [Candidatus Levybacteria bacterium]|nr:shikimate dehydrogenase [Candidatus Levybacteria bacterium]